ncbi:MAG: DUF3347 domain-containing protein [Bacteriovoracaceae bacterium]|nr:DUF3347 domain-containing protein [Bacteriovoracaceae bacterium]
MTRLLLMVALLSSGAFAAKTKKKLSDDVKKQVITVLEKNEVLHDAFFTYDGDKVEDAAEAVEDAIEAIKDPEIAKLLKFSKEKLDEIEDDKAREENNKAYNLVSMALIHVKNTYDLGDKYAAFSCPMVNKKWIQNKEKHKVVMNPYAPEMPNCGSMDE